MFFSEEEQMYQAKYIDHVVIHWIPLSQRDRICEYGEGAVEVKERAFATRAVLRGGQRSL